jgi:3-methylcrotonyl-CoA carboxylase alpha subunit
VAIAGPVVVSTRTTWRDGDRTRTVELLKRRDGKLRARVDGTEFEVEVVRLDDGRVRLIGAGASVIAEVTAAGTRRFVRLGALDFVLDREAEGARRGAVAHGGGLEAPMPGVVTRVMVAAGDRVTKGQPLVALEAMKMEHLIRAPRDGRVKTLHARAGEMVGGGVALVELADHEPGGEAR